MVIHVEETISTNYFLQELLKKEHLNEGTVVIAENQTAGRGQGENKWESEKGKNLTFSMVLFPDFVEVTEQFIISKVVSLGIADTLSDLVPDVSIKWPNDIYIGNKKVTGILIENSLSGKEISNSVIGIGINVNQDKFYSDAPNPVSLKQITNKDYDLNALLKNVMTNIFKRYSQLLNGDDKQIHEAYFSNLFRRDGYHLYKAGNEIFEACIIDIKPEGHLVLQTKSDNKRVFAFKEVEYIIE